MAKYMDEGLLEPHIARVNDLYRRKRDVAARILEERCPSWLSFRVPEGGFNHWVELAEEVLTVVLAEAVKPLVFFTVKRNA